MNKKTLGLSGLALLVGLGFSGCSKNVEKYNINGKKIILEQGSGILKGTTLIINDSIEIYDGGSDGVIGNEQGYDYVRKNNLTIGTTPNSELKYFTLKSGKNAEYSIGMQEEIKLKLKEANELYQNTMKEIYSIKVNQIREMKLN